MKTMTFPEDLQTQTGAWHIRSDISVANVVKRVIYHSPLEPSFVAWAILWKERSGALKLSFCEAIGDQTAWPPTYNFNSRDIQQYLKTLISEDNANTWKDTGWREPPDLLSIENSDHFIRHVFELPDGTLMRNRCHTIKGMTCLMRLNYVDDEGKHVHNDEPNVAHPSLASIWTSPDGGKSWKCIHIFDKQPPLFLTAIHPLSDGRIVALGAITPDWVNSSKWQGVLVESRDAGKTWSDPAIIVENDDPLNPQGLGEECDFVELSDGRLLVIWRVDTPGSISCMRQLYIKKNARGAWQAGPAQPNPFFVHSGYPYLHRASDGTIFYYCHSSIKYSCDDGVTWHALPLGTSYYGQLTELLPGRMLAVTQTCIGDSSYPHMLDASMLQTTFDYQRIGIVEQTDADMSNALAMLSVGQPKDFHVALEIRVNAAAGLAYQIKNDSFRFVAVTMPANASRLPSCEQGKEQDVFLVAGRFEHGKIKVLRKIAVGKTMHGAWAELQVSRHDELLKCAVRVPYNVAENKYRPARYICLRDEGADSGVLALYTNKSSGAFRHVRFDPAAGEIRSRWRLYSEEGLERIALDAGRATE